MYKQTKLQCVCMELCRAVLAWPFRSWAFLSSFSVKIKQIQIVTLKTSLSHSSSTIRISKKTNEDNMY